MMDVQISGKGDNIELTQSGEHESAFNSCHYGLRRNNQHQTSRGIDNRKHISHFTVLGCLQPLFFLL